MPSSLPPAPAWLARLCARRPPRCRQPVLHPSRACQLPCSRSADQDGVIYPVPPDVRRALDHPMFVNTLLTLDHFTVENAATRFVPGSHKWYDAAPRFRGIPPHYEPNDVEFVTPEAAPGTLMIFVSTTDPRWILD